MGGIFKAPKIKAPEPPPPPPTVDEDAIGEDLQRRMRARKGRAASVLSGKDQGSGGVATKMLLGQ